MLRSFREGFEGIGKLRSVIFWIILCERMFIVRLRDNYIYNIYIYIDIYVYVVFLKGMDVVVIFMAKFFYNVGYV